MSETHSTQLPQHYDDEIDLIELISNLWQEKVVVIITAVVVTALGLFYAVTSSPVYQASAQLEFPSTAELAPLNNTYLFKTSESGEVDDEGKVVSGSMALTAEEAFTGFLTVLASNDHINALVHSDRDLIATALGTNSEKITPESLVGPNKKLYDITYPNAKEQQNTLQPAIFSISMEGAERQALTKLLDRAVSLAGDRLVEKWEEEFEQLKSARLFKTRNDFSALEQTLRENRENTISRLEEERLLATKKIQDELNARKTLILKNRQDRLIQLEEAAKVAQKLGFKNPSTLSRLSQAGRSSNGQIEINTEIRNEGEPLYLRGTDLLSAELDNLKNLSDLTFLDGRVRELEAELLKLQSNPEIEILKNRESDLPFSGQLQSLRDEINRLENSHFPENFSINFLNNPAVSPESPIKPKKTLILAISVLLGGMLGLFIAVGRIVYRNYQQRPTDEAS